MALDRILRSTPAMLVLVSLLLAPVGARADDETTAEAQGSSQGNDTRPVGLTLAAVLLGADALFATGYGLYMLLDPGQCVQRGPTGECLRTSTPTESYRLNGAALVGVSAALYATTIVLGFLADEAWRAIAPRAAHASVRPWLAADESSGLGGMVVSW